MLQDHAARGTLFPPLRLSVRLRALTTAARFKPMEVTNGARHNGAIQSRSRGQPVGAGAGTAAFGAVAIGALAIGRLAVGRMVIKKARFGALEVDELTVRKLRVLEHEPGSPHERSGVRENA